MLGGGGSFRGGQDFFGRNNSNSISRSNKHIKSPFDNSNIPPFPSSTATATADQPIFRPSMDTDPDPEHSFFEPASTSPFTKSPWSSHFNSDALPSPADNTSFLPNILMGSLVREEGHIYSLAASRDLLYTGSDSKNIRVWKNHKEFSGFKSNSGLVKSIVIGGGKIFTGHQDGKVRVWKISSRDPSVHKRVGTLPTLGDYIKCSMRPSNYVEGRRRRNLWIKHFDAISSLSLSEDQAFLYSASWDKTFKVWRVSDSKCLESIEAHEDAVNTLVSSIDGMVYTGSADGSVKLWRRELQGKGTKHFFSQTLVKQECAVTALAVNDDATFVYCGSSDGVVNFWEREKSLSHGGVLRGHKLAILCLATAGHLLLSGSADMGICVWQRIASDHFCLSVLTGHTGPVKCLAVEKDNEVSEGERRWIVYSGSLDKSVKMWRVSEQPPSTFQRSPSFIPECSPTAGLLLSQYIAIKAFFNLESISSSWWCVKESISSRILGLKTLQFQPEYSSYFQKAILGLNFSKLSNIVFNKLLKSEKQ